MSYALGPFFAGEMERLLKSVNIPSLKFAVAVSGGSDSLALTFLLYHWLEACGQENNMVALTVNHHLRKESQTEAEQVGRWMTEKGISHHILDWYPDDPVKRLQEKAREARYDLLGTWCLAHDYPYLLTAHHGDDQIETFLQRLGHGSGLSGLLGIKPCLSTPFGWVLRPLLNCRKEELVQYLGGQGHPFICDPSNENPRFSRVLIRQNQPLLNSLGITADAIQKTIHRLEKCEQMIEKRVSEEQEKRLYRSDLGYQTLDLTDWADLDLEIRFRLLSRSVQEVRGHAYPPASSAIEGIMERLQAWERMVSSTVGGCLVFLKQKKVWVVRESRHLPEPYTVQGSFLWDQRFNLYTEKPVVVQPFGKKLAMEMAGVLKTSSVILQSLPVFVREDRIYSPHFDWLT